MSLPEFAAITLDRSGGGVALASRAMWDVFQERWRDQCRLLTLFEGPEAVHSQPPGWLTRLRFGARLAAARARGDSRWTFYSHLSVARAQMFMPPGVRRPYALFLHGIEAWAPFTRAQRRLVEGAAVVMSNSEYTARRVASVHPWMKPIAVCPLALPKSNGSATKAPASRPFEVSPLSVIVVARMAAAERYKGHDQLLEAWPAVDARIAGAQLVIVGTGDDESRLREKAVQLGVGRSVVFTGFVPDAALSALYDQAAVLALPSRNEGFGLVYLEAMSHRLPCIGSIHDAAGDVIDDGVTGFLVDQADSAALADRIVRLLTDAPLRRQMGAAGYHRLEQRFSYDRFRSRLLSLLDEAFDLHT